MLWGLNSAVRYVSTAVWAVGENWSCQTRLSISVFFHNGRL